MAIDMLNRPIEVGHYVVFFNAIYKVLDVPAKQQNDYGYVKIMLANPSKTTRPAKKYSREMFVIHPEDLVAWKLQYGGD